jgi:predicted metal-binding membrane protein
VSGGGSIIETALRRDRVIVISALVAVVVLAWGYLLVRAGISTHETSGMSMAMHQSWTPGHVAVVLLMWAVMMAAMMLPSAAPLVLVYGRGASGVSTAALVAGYLGIWAAVGVLAYAADRLIEDSRASALVLAAAGAYELTPLKARFLRECRDPAGFLITRWRGTPAGALRVGFEHGLFCLGCCWALMAVLVVAAAMGLAWAALIALAVFAEKVLPAPKIWRFAIAGALATLAVASLLR